MLLQLGVLVADESFSTRRHFHFFFQCDLDSDSPTLHALKRTASDSCPVIDAVNSGQPFPFNAEIR